MSLSRDGRTMMLNVTYPGKVGRRTPRSGGPFRERTAEAVTVPRKLELIPMGGPRLETRVSPETGAAAFAAAAGTISPGSRQDQGEIVCVAGIALGAMIAPP
jgi:hypothetical protein